MYYVYSKFLFTEWWKQYILITEVKWLWKEILRRFWNYTYVKIIFSVYIYACVWQLQWHTYIYIGKYIPQHSMKIFAHIFYCLKGCKNYTDKFELHFTTLPWVWTCHTREVLQIIFSRNSESFQRNKLEKQVMFMKTRLCNSFSDDS
jgi:hypothetical protein